jgi:hypothetical protein
MATMWNNVISPVVKEAVIKNSGKEAKTKLTISGNEP